MYALSCRPNSLSVSPGGRHLALCGQIIDGGDGDVPTSELMLLSLPEKLLCSDPRQEGLEAKRDFAFRAGAREQGTHSFLQVEFWRSAAELLTLNRDSVSHWTVVEGTGVQSMLRFTQ